MSDIATRIRKGDTVRVITGKDLGKEGKVIRAIAADPNPKKPRPTRLLVEGINIIIKHQRQRSQQNASPASRPHEHGRIEKEAPIYASKVQLICPACGKPTRIAVKFSDAGERFRACKKCGKQVD
ncbi:MAG: 50S ribosomal protein L24 [Capsulimonadaceae bacterium]|nr:50S ribosomal protein L24 [Capsulimonadaceae bacterium]